MPLRSLSRKVPLSPLSFFAHSKLHPFGSTRRSFSRPVSLPASSATSDSVAEPRTQPFRRAAFPGIDEWYERVSTTPTGSSVAGFPGGNNCIVEDKKEKKEGERERERRKTERKIDETGTFSEQRFNYRAKRSQPRRILRVRGNDRAHVFTQRLLITREFR